MQNSWSSVNDMQKYKGRYSSLQSKPALGLIANKLKT